MNEAGYSDKQLAEFRSLYTQCRSRRAYVLITATILTVAWLVAAKILGDQHVGS
jgi:hypothetical protein